MKIQLTEKEIVVGLQLYLNSVGINTNGQEVKVDFTSTRKPGSGGLVADVDINFIPVVTAAYAPQFRNSNLGESTVALYSQTDTLLGNADAVVEASTGILRGVGSSQTVDTAVVYAVSEDDDLLAQSSGSILDEVLAGVDEEKEEEPVVAKVATATSSLFASEE